MKHIRYIPAPWLSENVNDFFSLQLFVDLWQLFIGLVNITGLKLK